MVCIKDGKFSKIPLEEVAGKTKMVNVDNELIRQADSLGISLGRKA
jgi:6-phosphofructokinase 1